MEKVRKYELRKIEVCRNCGGEGMVHPKVEGNWLLRRMQDADRLVTCDVCGGTGRVRKHTEITVTVRSFQ
jgi:DnaJ-class molecular chaperone